MTTLMATGDCTPIILICSHRAAWIRPTESDQAAVHIGRDLVRPSVLTCRESRAISSLMCPCRPWMETRPADAGSMAGLEVAPIDTVTLSDRLSQDNRRCPPVLDRLLWSGPRKTA
jgi:hypothetical protein